GAGRRPTPAALTPREHPRRSAWSARPLVEERRRQSESAHPPAAVKTVVKIATTSALSLTSCGVGKDQRQAYQFPNDTQTRKSTTTARHIKSLAKLASCNHSPENARILGIIVTDWNSTM